jgi:hypothetical protein
MISRLHARTFIAPFAFTLTAQGKSTVCHLRFFAQSKSTVYYLYLLLQRVRAQFAICTYCTEQEHSLPFALIAEGKSTVCHMHLLQWVRAQFAICTLCTEQEHSLIFTLIIAEDKNTVCHLLLLHSVRAQFAVCFFAQGESTVCHLHLLHRARVQFALCTFCAEQEHNLLFALIIAEGNSTVCRLLFCTAREHGLPFELTAQGRSTICHQRFLHRARAQFAICTYCTG